MSDDSPAGVAPQADDTLLRRFIDERDEQAFRMLVERHGSLVLSACRRGAPTEADAEDAFQATFIVLAQSAEKICHRGSLAAWLYGVACRVCARLRRERVRHATSQLLEPVVTYEDPLDELLARHDELVTDEELAALPESLRTPLVLRYLAGKSNAQVAEELGISIAALEGRLKRAKSRLRLRLIRRGVTLAAAVAVLRSTRVASAELPVTLVERAVSLSTAPAAPLASSVNGNTSTPIHLAQQEMIAVKSMLISKPLVAALVLGGSVTLAVGIPLAVSQSLGGDQPAGITLAVEAPANNPFGEAPASTKVTSSAGADDPFGAQQSDNAGRGRRRGQQQSDADPFEASSRSESANVAAPLRESTFVAAPSKDWEPELAPLSPADATIRNVLSRQSHEQGFQFQVVTLEKIAQIIQDEYEIPIQLNFQALDDVGIVRDEPVTINVPDVSLRSALRMILRTLDLTYIIRDEVLEITSPEEAEQHLETRVHTIGSWGIEPEQLMDVIMSTVATDTWAENGGGEADMRPIPGGIVVQQTLAVHELINQLLRQLQAHSQKMR